MMRALATALICTALAACNMNEQPKDNEYKPSALFPNGRTLQTPVPGTVARDDLKRSAAIATKPPLTKALLDRGQEVFNINCSPCHGRTGAGDGMIVQRGMPRPPDYTEDRLRKADDQHFFDVITHGHGAMYSYATRVPPADRWAVVAYIRALQLSRHATLDDVPQDRRAKLQSGAPQ